MRGRKKQGDTFGSRGAYGGIRVLFRPNRKKGGMEMLQSLGWAAAGTGFTFLMTALGAATVFIGSGMAEAWFQKAVLGFAAGVMTAASVWSLLIPAIEQVRAGGILPGWIPAAAGMLAGPAFLAGMDGFILRHRRDRSLLMMAITLHNIPEGMAVGLAFALAESGESAAGQQGYSRTKAFTSGMMSGSVEPVFGILVVLAAASAQAALPWLLSFAAGAMLYVAVEELIPQAHSRAGTCGFVGGFLVMMILDVALG